MITEPTLSETWYTRANAEFPDSSSVYNLRNSAIFLLKSMLIGECTSGTIGPEGARPTGSYWTVWASSNATSSLADTDLWGTQFTASNYIQAASGSNHSWMTLKSPAAMGNVFLTIDLCSNPSAGTADQVTFVVANITDAGTPIGHGLEIKARPYSAYDYAPGSAGPSTPSRNNAGTSIIQEQTTNCGHMAHFSCNSSGEFEFFLTKCGYNLVDMHFSMRKSVESNVLDSQTVWSFLDVVVNGYTAASWDNGYVYNRLHDASAVQQYGGFIYFSPLTTQIGYESSSRDYSTSKFRAWPIILMSYISTSSWAIRGRIKDMYAGGRGERASYTGQYVGARIPATGSMQFCQVGHFLLPFSVPPIT